MSKRLLSFLALALLCFSFVSVTIQAPAHAETQCYYPGTTGFSKPRNDYEAGNVIQRPMGRYLLENVIYAAEMQVRWMAIGDVITAVKADILW